MIYESEKGNVRSMRERHRLEMEAIQAEIRPIYPASKAKMYDIRYALATMMGSFKPHNSK